MSGPISDYECETCGKAFPAGGHARDQHCEDTGHCSPEFECPSCPRWFNSEQACEQHIDATGHYWETWDSDGYGCRCCMDTWATEMDRDDHEQEDHFYCSECDRFFDSYYSLDQASLSRRPPNRLQRLTQYFLCSTSVPESTEVKISSVPFATVAS